MPAGLLIFAEDKDGVVAPEAEGPGKASVSGIKPPYPFVLESCRDTFPGHIAGGGCALV